MINQPEERPLSIGSAVQFTHKGKTIHGHLLQRQGRRRFAKIVDTEERTWKVPESALKHSGGARRVTIITRHDNARAAYRVGDEVTFTSPDGPRRGSIVKLNPKSAQVRCGKTCWNVSGNPSGRPKGTTSKKLTPPLDPLAKIVLDEAARLIPVRDGDRTVTVSMQQAIIRRLAVDAAKGEPRAQRLFTEMLALSEAEAQRAAEQVLEPILTIRRIIVDPKDPSARHDSETDA